MNKILTINQGGLVRKLKKYIYHPIVLIILLLTLGSSGKWWCNSPPPPKIKISIVGNLLPSEDYDSTRLSFCVEFPVEDTSKYKLDSNGISLVIGLSNVTLNNYNINIEPDINYYAGYYEDCDSYKYIYYRKYMTLKRIRNNEPVELSFGSIPITLNYNIIDKETHVSIYGPDLNTSITLYKVLNIEIDYNYRAYSKISSLQLNYADTLNLDNTERIFAKVDSLLPPNIKLNINKQFESSAYHYFYNNNFDEISGTGFYVDVPDTIFGYDDTLHNFSNYCYNSADVFCYDHYLGYQYSVHLIFSGNPSEMGPLNTYPYYCEIFGATRMAYGNMKWDLRPWPNYNNYIYIFVNTAYNYYYNTHINEYCGNVEELDKDFINLLSMTIAHELGHNIGHLEDCTDMSNIMCTGVYWGIQDSLNRHFEDFQNISIQNESQFYFRTH